MTTSSVIKTSQLEYRAEAIVSKRAEPFDLIARLVAVWTVGGAELALKQKLDLSGVNSLENLIDFRPRLSPQSGRSSGLVSSQVTERKANSISVSIFNGRVKFSFRFQKTFHKIDQVTI